MSVLDKPTSFTHQWLWVDGVFDGYMAVDRIDKIFVTDPRTPPLGRLASISNRTQQVILLGYAEGQGPYPKPWEKRYWRLTGRGVGAFEEPDGTVCCERGEWRLDEITDPAANSWPTPWPWSRGSSPSSP